MKIQSWMAVGAVSLAVACGGGQTAECKKLMACLEAAAPDVAAVQAEAYGPNGSCWTSGDLASACNTACVNVNGTNKTTYANISACQ